MYAQGFDLRHVATGHLATRTTQLLVTLYAHFTTPNLNERPAVAASASKDAAAANARWLESRLEATFRTREVEGRRTLLLAAATGVLVGGNLTKVLLRGWIIIT